MHEWFRLPHLAGLRISGPDAWAFAHAQFTSAFKAPARQQWQLTAWCNPKGRVISLMLARVADSRVDLILPAVQLPDVSRGLPMYAIGRQVSFDEPVEVAGVLSGGDEAQRLAVDAGRSLELGPMTARHDQSSVERWRRRDIQAGIAWLDQCSSACFLPQSLGLEERGGLSYQKGCYPGQEIIARVHFLGKLKQRLTGFRTAALRCHAADGRALELHDDSGRSVGQVLYSVEEPGACSGLAVIAADCAAEAGVFIGGEPAELRQPEAL